MTVHLPDDWRRFVTAAAANADAAETRENLRPDFWVRHITAEAALKLAFKVDELEGFKVYVSNNPGLGLMVPACLVDPPADGLVLVLAEYIDAGAVLFHGWCRDASARARYAPRAVVGRGPLLHVVPLKCLTNMRDLAPLLQ